MLSIEDFLQAVDGRGVVNVLTADKLLTAPRLYATFLLWMLSELFEYLPEVGDLDKPKLVFFFDEAHLLFADAPAALVERIELVVRLVRSKGVGVYFVTQNPLDIPDSVLAQLGNRVQHALRAFTPRDQKAVKAAASTMRTNPKLDAEAAIGELAVGEALVSLLDAKGTPSVTERAFVVPPGSQIGPITPEQRKALLASSLVAGAYDEPVDRESAYEKLKGRAAAGADAAQQAQQQAKGSSGNAISDLVFGSTGPRGGRREGLVEKAASSAVRSIGSAVGRQIMRGVLGSIFGGGSRRRSSGGYELRHQRSRHRPCAARGRARADPSRRSRSLGRDESVLAADAPRRRARRVEGSGALLLAGEGAVAHLRRPLLDAGARRARAPAPARHRIEGIHAAHGGAAARDRARDDPRVHRRGRRERRLRVRQRAGVTGAAAADRGHAGPARGALRPVPALERRHRIVRREAAQFARVRRRPGAARGAAARGGGAAARASRATI